MLPPMSATTTHTYICICVCVCVCYAFMYYALTFIHKYCSTFVFFAIVIVRAFDTWQLLLLLYFVSKMRKCEMHRILFIAIRN